MTRRARIAVDRERLEQTLHASSAIGADPAVEGGMRRLALNEADRRMRDVLVEWCVAAGYSVRVDRVGNVFARREGADRSLAPVLVGSHLDTQDPGGRFDGVLGVLAALELMRTLDDHGIETSRPLELVSWTNEEGARFQPTMLGSAVATGAIDLDTALAGADADGITLGQALQEAGYAGEAPVPMPAVDAYLELHIEQGPELDAAGVDVGIVTGGWPVRALRITVTGETAHSGPTPMARRRNALVGAARVVVAVDDIGRAHRDARSTCTRLTVSPNRPGIVPESAELLVDMRHAEATGLERMLDELSRACRSARHAAAVEIEVSEAWRFGGIDFDPVLAGSAEDAAARMGVATRRMRSLAGHDAYNLASAVPTLMIFTPCREGITHNPGELIEMERTIPGVDVLLHTVLERTGT